MLGRVGAIVAALAVCLGAAGCKQPARTGKHHGAFAPATAASVTSSAPVETDPAVPPDRVVGVATFDDPQVDPATGEVRLEPAPIVGARVVLLDADDQVVASGVTDAQGRFSLRVPDEAGGVRVAVLARLAGAPSVAVHAPGSLDPWSVASGPVRGGTAVEVHAPAEGGAPFNALDAVSRGLAFVRALEPAAALPDLRVEAGPGVDGTYYGEGVLRLTGADVDHSLDDAVVLHELGHYVMDALVGPGVGGEHRGCDDPTPQVLDRRLAFSEAWASTFSCLVRGDSRMVEAGVGTSADLERPCEQAMGPGSEDAVAAALWDLVDGTAGLPDEDGDGVALPVPALWRAFRALADVPHFDVASLAAALIEQEALTQAQWTAAFGPRCLGLPMPPLACPLALGACAQGHVDASVRQATLLAASGYHLVDVPAEGTLTVTLDSHPQHGALTITVWTPEGQAIPMLASAARVRFPVEGVGPGPHLVQVSAQGDGQGQPRACYALHVAHAPR